MSPLSNKNQKMPLHIKIFIGLFAGIIIGYILNFMGGLNNPMIKNYIIPFLSFLGSFFLKSIKMVIVPLVFFSVTDAALSLGDIKKLRSIGIKTVLFFLGGSALSASIGLIVANIIKPGKGIILGHVSKEVAAKKLPGIYQTILDLLPNNPFASLTNGDMMPVIVFSLLLGFSIILMGEKGEPLAKIISNLSEAMFNIINMIVKLTPYGVFGLMSVAMAKY
ncbi:MAG: cation:dicarboxylase symporter family transporter, partial [Fusobacterium sp. JB021]|nr:cation:dicarboxylase symporter family transporter [Fusobacterium sp. JB021]